MSRLLSVYILGLALVVSCTTSQQRTLYTTLAAAGSAVNGAYSGYLDTVIKGTTSTNSVPDVSRAYNTFQAAFLVAVNAAQLNLTNVAPANVQTQASDFVTMISQVKGH